MCFVSAVRRLVAVTALLTVGALGACGGGKGKDAPSDAAPDEPPIDAGPPDAMPGDAGSIAETWQLPGTGQVSGGTVSMDVEIGHSIEPAMLHGGTYTLEVGGSGSKEIP
jgi:hypothetical protein